eukprot:CAMPEP_0197028310 /NCGR_PEP_ID=MMETSP1384-20130603/8024_1 /TAXON_ID=29189 /ORGANISM="Ammonia sp." /LENGTH=232 /DNA_ID=CAMNT_0042457291 /DNA_START=42 /DNA_END=740 /DNA_ORIENTATION=+
MSNFEVALPDTSDAVSVHKRDFASPMQEPQTQNVVATLNVACRLDLKEIVTRSRNSEYNPKRFAAVVMRIREPKSTALIFQTGKIVVTGARSEDNAWIAARKYARILQKLDFPAHFREFTIQNIVGSCDVGFPIRLEGLANQHNQFSSYEPELFPGLIYRMNNPKIVILAFVSGKIVLTGGKSKQQINEAFSKIYPILVQFRKDILDQDEHTAPHTTLMDIDQDDDDLNSVY